MSNSLGQLAKAPLVYVLAQLVFTRVPKMGQYWEDVHQSVFEEFPESKIEDIKKLSLSDTAIGNEQERRWNMLTSDRRKGIILSSDSLIFHTTKYVTSKEFFTDLENIVSALINVLPSSSIQVNRIGLRYVDLLIPHENTPVNMQVVEKLGMLDLSEVSCEPLRFERVANYKTSIGGELVLRHRQTTGADVMPSDLFPNILKPAALMQGDKPEGIVGLLDYDHFVKDRIAFDSKIIIERFRSLHQVTSAAFRVTTTSNAMNVWSS